MREIEKFHQELGGIVGYQYHILSLLKGNVSSSSSQYSPPNLIDIREKTPEVKKAIYEGIARFPEMGVLCPLGGAGDRLGLIIPETGEPLPAAKLEFNGVSLLEGLIRDIEGKEYLYEKLFGEKIITPIALMTSHEKNNDAHIRHMLWKNNFFDRPKESFFLFSQPSVPVVTKKGKWCLKDPHTFLLKPGGHGVIWKLALQKNVFDWFAKQHRSKALIRQINNPIAGLDDGLLAFTGFGHMGNHNFGFASCPRQAHAKEGVNILIEKEGKLALSNIEYCNFEKFGIQEPPNDGDSLYPSNTNILFANLREIVKAAKDHPYPGLLLNFKDHAHYLPEVGIKTSPLARIESTMQNIADHIAVNKRSPLRTYVTYNHRIKTISAVKSRTNPFALETPETGYRDLQKNAHELLTDFCDFSIGAAFTFRYHPALGPLYSIISQKLKRGTFNENAKLSLELSDALIEDLYLDGSLLITATPKFGAQSGKCILQNVHVEKQESVQIILHKNAALIAKNITLKGNQTIEVPENRLYIAKDKAGQIEWVDIPVPAAPDGLWQYSFDSEHNIHLELNPLYDLILSKN